MSILEQLGIIKKPEKYTLDKIPRLRVYADISSLFAEQIWLEQNDAEIRRLTIAIFDTLKKYNREIDKNNQFRFGNFIVQIDFIGKTHTIENPTTREKISVDLSHGNHLVIVEKGRF